MSAGLAKRCAEVLRGNDRGTHTVPSPRLYPHQWAWDSAFAAIGWAHIDKHRAVAEMRSLLGAAWPDGRIPHIRFDPESRGYWPGPEFWRTRVSSSITQPPLWATAALRLLQLGVDGAELAPLVPAIEASLLFFRAQRDPKGLGLVAVAHPWESGCDNSPAWDLPLEAIDPSRSPPLARRDTDHVDPAQRPDDTLYRRYAVLVQAIADDNFGPGPFAVYDPMMSACLARAERDLAALGQALDLETRASERADRIERALLTELWDDSRKRFAFYDARRAQRSAPDVIGAYLPLMLDLPEVQRQALESELRSRYWTTWPLPSAAPDSAAFEPQRYWRGPTWINTNWLLTPRLGPELRERTLELVDRAGCWEYYHPETGQGLGGEQFTWTAALTLDLMADG